MDTITSTFQNLNNSSYEAGNYTSTPALSSSISALTSPASLLYYLDRYANTFLLPLVIGLGVVGNALSFCVFRFTALRNYPSNVYLSALAVADCGFMVALFVNWLGVLHVPLVHLPVVCRINVYGGYVFGFLSVWLV